MKKLITAIILFSLMGCNDTKNGNVRLQTHSVRVVETKNGLECAIWKGYKAGGMSCNWQKYNEQEEGVK